jgi:subtilase family serine protease
VATTTNLRVSSITSAAQTLAPAGTLTNVTLTLARTGAAIPANTTVSLLIGLTQVNAYTNNIVTLRLENLTNQQIADLNGANGTTTITIPALALPTGNDLADPGTYHLGAFIDWDQDVDEANEADNAAFTARNVTVALPELSATTTLSPASQVVSPGQSVTATITLRNTGVVAAGPFVAAVYLFSEAQQGVGTFLGELTLGTAVTPGLLNGATRTFTNVSFPLPTTIAPGSYRLVVVVDDAQDVAEVSETNNVSVLNAAGTTITVPARGADQNGSDLTITGPTAPLTLINGAPSTALIQARLNNLGNAAATGSTVSAYLSTDGVLDANDFALSADIFGGQLVASAFAPGSTNGDVAFAIPGNVPVGQYFLILFADENLDVTELDENNNQWVSASRIVTVNGAPNSPNLNTASVALGQAAITAGGTLPVTVSFRNQGASPSAGFSARFVLTTNDILGDADDIVITPTNAADLDFAGLAAGATSASRTITLNIPGNLPAGVAAYRLAVITDSAGAVSESNEGDNNTFTAANGLAVTAPDLRVTSAFAGGRFARGATVTIPTSISNVSQVPSGAFVVRYVLTINTTIGDEDDIELGTVNRSSLPANGSAAFNQQFTLPANSASLPAGDYRVAIIVDSEGDVTETNEANNTFTSTALLIVDAPNLTATVTVAQQTVAPGGLVNASVLVRNTRAVASGAFIVRVWLSENDSVQQGSDVLLQEFSLTGLAASGSQNLAVSVPLPAAAVPLVNSGRYRVIAQVDPADTVEEVDPVAGSDNVVASSPAVLATAGAGGNGADLVGRVLQTAAISTIPTGTFTVPVQFSNIGNALTGLAGATGRLLLSSNNTFSGDDIEIGTFTIPADTRPGATNISVDATVPDFVNSGTYFLVLVVDSDDDVTETNENNNIAVTTGALVTVTRPVVSVSATVPTAAETASGAARNGNFRFTRTGGSLTSPLVVNYTVRGTATASDNGPGTNNDYRLLTGTVTIPAGAAFIDVPVVINDDLVGELDETVIVQVGRGAGYNINTTLNTATVTVQDNEARVSISGSTSIAESTIASARTGTYTVTRTGPTTGALVVRVQFGTPASGAAAIFTDDVTSSATFNAGFADITIPAGATSATFTMTAVDDNAGEGEESFRLSIAPPVGAAYLATPVVTGQSVTTRVVDNEPVVTLSAVDAAGAETNPNLPPSSRNGLTFRISRSGGVLTQPLTVNVTWGGGVNPATNGTDYGDANAQALPTSFTIPANATFVDIPVRVIADTQPETAESVVLTLNTTSQAYQGGLPATRTATGTIADLALTDVQISNLAFAPNTPVNNLPITVAGQTIQGTFSATNSGPAGNVTFRYVLSANGVLGDADDIVLGSQTVAMTAGQTATITIENASLDNPAYLPPGLFNFGVIATPVTPDVDAANNTAIAGTQVNLVAARADISAASTTFGASTSYIIGGSSLVLNASSILGNATPGTTLTAVPVRYVLTSNATIGDADDVLLATSTTTGVLNGGSTATNTATLTLNNQAGLAAGTYRLGAIVQAGAADGTANNNTVLSTNTITITQGVNLAGSAVTNSTTLSIVGGAVSGGFTGTGFFQNFSTFSVPITVQLLINTVNDFTAGFTVLAQGTTNAPASQLSNLILNAGNILNPGALAAGNYFVAVRIIVGGTFTDLTPADNITSIGSSSLTISVS